MMTAGTARVGRLTVLRTASATGAIRLAAALGLGAVFHLGYRLEVADRFSYARYSYTALGVPHLLLTYLLIVVPLAGYRSSHRLGNMICAILYAIAYVPGQIVLSHSWNPAFGSAIPLQMLWCVSMLILFGTANLCFFEQSSREPIAQDSETPSGHMDKVLLVASGFVSFAIILFLGARLRLVDFASVYDLRIENSEAGINPILSYGVLWQTYLLIPYAVASGVVRRSAPRVVHGMIGGLVVYALTASKLALLVGLILLLLGLVYRDGEDLLRRLLVALGGATVAVLLLPESGLAVWVRSIFLVRVLSIGGWSVARYFEFFSESGYTNLTHLSPVAAVVGGYQYSPFSPGQLVGHSVSGSYRANANSGFWASEGIAGFGPWGMLIITPAIVVMLVLLNTTTRSLNRRFLLLCSGGFVMALMNLPITIALFSGGGIFLSLLRPLSSNRDRRPSWSTEVSHRAVQLRTARSRVECARQD